MSTKGSRRSSIGSSGNNVEMESTEQPEAGPSRSPSLSTRSTASRTSSRKGKERAIADDDSSNPMARKASGGSHGNRSIDRQSQAGRSGFVVPKHTENDENEDEGEEEEEDEEPVLKYSRLKGKIPEILAKDSASAIDVSPRVLAVGTHNGMVHILSYEGAKINSYRPHAASVTCLKMDEDNDYVATTSMEGRVVIHSLTTPDDHAFDYKRPMHCIALEPNFAKKTTKAFACGGMAGNLIMQEKGWLGYKEQILHSGEGPIWAIEWRGDYIAWANDLGVKIYDTSTSIRIGYIDRPADAPRAELYKPTIQFKDDHTLIIGWADYVKIVKIRSKSRSTSSSSSTMVVEMSAIYQVDCMISGLSVYSSTSLLILAYLPPENIVSEATEDRMEQRRKAANRPELRIIDKGEEVSADALGLSNYHLWGCNDYRLIKGKRSTQKEEYFVLSPKDLISVRKRDERDHIEWLVERERFEEALESARKLEKKHGGAVDSAQIGRKYMQYLIEQKEFARSAALAPQVLGPDAGDWEKWIEVFKASDQLAAIIPYIPTRDPQLSKSTYETILDYLLLNDKVALLSTINSWPVELYDIRNVMSNVNSELEGTKSDPILSECLGQLYILNRQPAKALPYFLKLRKPNVFDLIRDYNLFSSIQDQAYSLIEFDQERVRPELSEGQKDEEEGIGKHGRAVELLVEHTHSVPIDKVVHQLEKNSKYLYMYLDALFEKDAQVVLPYSDKMVELYAEYDQSQLMPFLRSSNFYDLEKAYKICKKKDYVPEQVFLLGRMGNNKQALMLIIERLGDVQRAIDFAKEQKDEDLWEDLLTYSETRPNFIRALLEHVGSEINPLRLIKRIKNGLEIPDLKAAVIKILQASNLQAGLLEGCQRILEGDVAELMLILSRAQNGSLKGSPTTNCLVCNLPAYPVSSIINSEQPLTTLIYLCRHTIHAACALPHPDLELPLRLDNPGVTHLLSGEGKRSGKTLIRQLGGKLGYAAALRVRVGNCPICLRNRGNGSLERNGARAQAGVAVRVSA